MATLGVHLVYHGTCLVHGKSILHNGIDLANQRQMTNFSKGLYTTTQWDQATTWALQTCRLMPAETDPVVGFDHNPACPHWTIQLRPVDLVEHRQMGAR